MKISVVCTLRNEEDNIESLIKDLIDQIKKPNEIIFIDDDSKDKTWEILNKYARKYKEIRIFKVNNHNISKNRNFGISKSKGDFILTIDGGCSIRKDYLDSLIKCLKEKNDKEFFGAITKIPYTNNFEHCYSLLLERIPSFNYLPKGHAFFFKKNLWERLSGFNENLKTAEDTEFIAKAKAINKSPVICKNAIIYWKPRRNLREIFTQFYRYGKGDRKAFELKNLPIKSKINLLITIIFPLSILHALYTSLKMLLKTKKISSFCIGFIMDLTKIYAYSLGLISNLTYHN